MSLLVVCWSTSSCDASRAARRPNAIIEISGPSMLPLMKAPLQDASLAAPEYVPATLPRKQPRAHPDSSGDVLVIGAGPTGLACAIEAQKLGLKVPVLDKGCLVNSIYHYPANMVFFTTPELLEIGDIPFATAHQKPTRLEALEYYRKVAEYYRLDVRQYETVQRLTGTDGNFLIDTHDRTS